MSILKKEAPLSEYFNEQLYERLFAEQSRGRGVPDAPTEADSISDLLHFEARLLDESRFVEWIELYSDECVYWVPGSYPAEDSRSSVSITLDDRRRIEDRIARYETGYAFSQLPLSRTAHVLGRSECWKLDGPDRYLARTPFYISELRRGETNSYSGFYDHIVLGSDKGREIEQKHVHLLQADQLLKNISFVF